MQALNVNPVSVTSLALNPHLTNEIYEPSLKQKSVKASDKVNSQESNILSLQKSRNIKRLLEAYSDCV